MFALGSFWGWRKDKKTAKAMKVWMEAEMVPDDDCPHCPWTCPECGSELTKYFHDGWECLICGVVY